MLWLLGIGKWLKEAAGAAIAWIGRNPLLAALIASLCLTGWLWHRNAVHINERDAARAQYSELVAANKRIIAAGKKLEAASKDLANATDKKTVVTVTTYRDRVLRLPSAPSGCAGPKGDVPASVAGPRSDPIVLNRSDALICADNTARLQESHDWALGMEALQNAPQGEHP